MSIQHLIVDVRVYFRILLPVHALSGLVLDCATHIHTYYIIIQLTHDHEDLF